MYRFFRCRGDRACASFKSPPNAGIFTFIHRAYNQRDERVASCKRSGLQRRKPT